ncbi:hypothetical protein A0H81_06250 [Grifola frondosa]|uniref:BTB domain-containing protein n=1 Tax=Grifola frondosa TaxID=5627 RepID=A0A1C7M9Z7_GRIFR|nr:hypothetical protein A0H81_06250 [Grifola frondosa]
MGSARMHPYTRLRQDLPGSQIPLTLSQTTWSTVELKSSPMAAMSPSSLAWNPETKEHPFTYPDADVPHLLRWCRVSSTQAHDSPDKPAIACASRDIPVVDVAERSAVIYHLLLLLYPIRDLAPISLENLRDALAASLKYDIEKATDVLSSRLALLVKDAPLRVYAIACMFELEDVAKLAVKDVFQQKMYLGDSDFPELDKITAGAYHRLLEYCKKGGAVEGFSFSVLPRNAPHPFDRSDADVVLCSSDLVHFHVHSTVLRIISPFFPDELEKLSLEPSIPAEGSESVDHPKSTHLISLTEDSATISSLLSAYYDILLGDTLISARIIQTLDKSWTLFSAAKKYGMQRAIKLLRTDLLAFTTKRPLSVFLLASRLNYLGIGIKAARQSLRGGLSLSAVIAPTVEMAVRMKFVGSESSSIVFLKGDIGGGTEVGLKRRQYCNNDATIDVVHAQGRITTRLSWYRFL